MSRGVRVPPSALLAAALAAAGVVAVVWRPTAPSVGAVVTSLDRFAPDVVETVRAYRWPRYLGGTVALVLATAVPVAACMTRAGRRAVAALAGSEGQAAHRAGLVAVALAVAADVVTLPIAVLLGYVQDGAYGFRTSDALGWARDWVVSRGVGWVLTAAAATVLFAVIARRPATWHWHLVLLGVGATAVVVLLGPVTFERLWLETRPLEDGRLRSTLAPLLDRAGVGDAQLLVGDASRRTTRANAYVSGLGPTDRVVLYDTLLELPDEQVAVVVAHELAHRQHRDVLRGVAMTGVALLPLALLLRGVLDAPRTRRLMDVRGPADPRLAAPAAAVVAVAVALTLPVSTAVSRRSEAAADHRALELSGDPAAAVGLDRTFVVRDLAHPAAPTWIRLLFATHPSPAERVRAAVAYAQRHGLDLPSLEAYREAEEAVRHPRLGDGS